MEQGWPGLAQYIPAVPADWSPRPRTVQDALDQLATRTGGSGAATSFVFRPSGVAAPGVYTTPAALKAALGTVDADADKVIVVDTTSGAAHLTAADSPWPLNNATIEGKVFDVLTLDAGCTFAAGVANLRLRMMELVVDALSAAPLWTPTTAGAFLDVQTAVIVNNSAVAWIDVPAGKVLDVFARVGSALQTGLLAKIENTATVNASFLDGSKLGSGTFVHGAAPGGNLSIVTDGASQPLISQALQDSANLTTAYTNLDPVTSFVFQPGGTAGGNVYTTPAALQTAIKLNPGHREVLCDGSFGALHLSGAGWDLDNTTLRVVNIPGTNFTLFLDVGFTMTSGCLRIMDGLDIQNNATATPWTPAGFFQLHLEHGVGMSCGAGAAPFLAVTGAAGGSQIFVGPECQLGDGNVGHNVVTVSLGTIVYVIASGGQQSANSVNPHAFAGLGAATVYGDGSVGINPTQDITTFTFTNGLANTTQASNNTGTGTGTASVVTGNIQKKKTGQVLVTANIAGTTSAGTTVTLQLVRDAATNIGNPIVETTLSAGDGFHGSISFVDTLPDLATHTYKLTATAAVGNINVGGANSAQISCAEL